MRITTLILAAGLVASSALAQNAAPDAPPPPMPGLDGPPPGAPWMDDAAPGDRPRLRQHAQRDGGPRRGLGGPDGRRPRIDRAKVLEEFDADGDGTLNEAERKAAHDTMQGRMHAQAFQRFDADGDGQISRQEWRAAHREAGSFGGPDRRRGRPGPADDRMRGELLERFDADADGQLSEAERRAARDAFTQRREQGRARMLEQFDADGDGELSEAEHQAARDAAAARREGQHRRALEEFDADGDGQLTGDERKAAGDAMRVRFQQMRRLGVVDANRDRSINKDELAAGLVLVSEGDPRADFNGDGKVTPDDAAALVELVDKMPR